MTSLEAIAVWCAKIDPAHLSRPGRRAWSEDARVDAVERRISAARPGIARIIVHAEPVRHDTAVSVVPA